MGLPLRCFAAAAMVGSACGMRATQEEVDLARVEDATKVANKAADETALCKCMNPFNGLWPKDCCQRTDSGSLKWKDGEGTTCSTLPEHSDCEWYCSQYLNCAQVEHKNDKQGLVNYLGEKIGEVGNLPEDILLARASWQAQLLQDKSKAKQVNVRVAGVHQLHPVGSWREETWQKTQKRKEAILKAKAVILSRGGAGSGGVLTEEDLRDVDDLAPMRSVTPFIAAPFPYCGNTHVLLEGNGRVRAMKLAAEEDPDLARMKVEVTELYFPPENVKTVHEGIALLWNQYATMIPNMNATEAARVEEYSQFKVNVGTCIGDWGRPCPVLNAAGAKIGEIPKNGLFGIGHVSRDMATKGWRYQMCDHPDQYVLSAKPGIVTETCPTCSQHLLEM